MHTHFLMFSTIIIKNILCTVTIHIKHERIVSLQTTTNYMLITNKKSFVLTKILKKSIATIKVFKVFQNIPMSEFFHEMFISCRPDNTIFQTKTKRCILILPSISLILIMILYKFILVSLLANHKVRALRLENLRKGLQLNYWNTKSNVDIKMWFLLNICSDNGCVLGK